MIANDLANLRRLFAERVRHMTLTHNVTTDWADSNAEDPRHGGLSDFGREDVRAILGSNTLRLMEQVE